MRIRRLDLLRYGRFTDTVLELPAHKPDIHILFGPNEAGKSTALSALEDFLFGIPHNSPLNFLHDYGSMRIGAVLQKHAEKLEARRRKGKKDTLLTPEDVPIPAGDAALDGFLAGADRNFFVRMFSLDHERLRQGGREILEARDEVGQMLFSAGAGIAGLRDRLKALGEEADALWASRRAARRRYYQVEDRLKAAESALREHTVTAGRWQELRRAYETSREVYDALEEEIGDKSAERLKLSRIRRVYPHVWRKSELEAGIAALGDVTPFPEDARRILEKAERDDSNAAARIETLAEQLEGARKERQAMICDEALLLRTEDIQQLHERRIQVRAGRADLPKRRAELAGAEAALRRLAGELEWEKGDIERLVARLPARSKVGGVRTLLSRRGGLFSSLETAEAALMETETRIAEIAKQIGEMGAAVDVSTLAAVIRATRECGDITSRIKGAESEAQEAHAAIQRYIQSLRPEVSSEEALASMHVPPLDLVQSHRDDRRDLEQRLHTCRERIRAAEQELIRHRKAHERVARQEHAVPAEELALIRRHRDTGWSLIRKRYVEGASVPEEDVRAFVGSGSGLIEVYEAVVSGADETADRRFERAEAAARLVVISRQIGEEGDLLEGLQKEEEVLREEGRALNAAWEAMWTGVPFSPLSPDVMLEWITARSEILGCVERRAAAERQVAALRREEAEAMDRLCKELERLGVDLVSLDGQSLRVVLESAADIQRRYEQDAETRGRLEEELRRTEANRELKRKGLEKAQRAWSNWKMQWVDALSALELDAAASPEEVAAQVNAIDEMREIAVRVNDLRIERIGKIERDMAAFRRDVAQVVAAVAPDLMETEPDDAVLELERRLHEARRIRDLQKGKDEAIISFEEKIRECEESRREARRIIRHFQETAGVGDIDELRVAIERSDRLRYLQTELSQVLRTLIQEGDGLSAALLHDECDAVDPDQIAVREETLGQDLEELRERLMEAREQRSAARKAFEAIGGDDAAARAGANRQAALADMMEVAERYVRVRSAALLLQWAIDRYRREKQAPLLKRAGQLFTMLTNGSFTDLRLEFDEQDHGHLAGLRPDGIRVGVQGMSTGTADQLYLALRVASVEDYLGRANPLPFVADDLFINFDDARAAAGFGVLEQLARKTQVLFFTHHRHLVDLARTALGPSVSIITLP
jgi:uncharacterized protein YhaN